MSHRKSLLISSLMCATIVLSGCANPVSKITHKVQTVIDPKANQPKIPVVKTDAQTKMQNLFTQIASKQTITDQQMQTIVNYYQSHHDDNDKLMFEQNISNIANAIENQSTKLQTGTSMNPDTDLNAAILMANYNWPIYVNDIRNHPKHLIYTRLTKATQSINNYQANAAYNTIFSSDISKQAINHIFPIYNQTTHIDKDAYPLKIDPVTGQQIPLTKKQRIRFMKLYKKTHSNLRDQIHANKTRINAAYQIAINDQKDQNIGTIKKPDNDLQRAIAIVNYTVCVQSHYRNNPYTNPKTVRPAIRQLLTTKYHFTPSAILGVDQQILNPTILTICLFNQTYQLHQNVHHV